ncbi:MULTISPECIES: hypothetical protein [Streptomyces]
MCQPRPGSATLQVDAELAEERAELERQRRENGWLGWIPGRS